MTNLQAGRTSALRAKRFNALLTFVLLASFAFGVNPARANGVVTGNWETAYGTSFVGGCTSCHVDSSGSRVNMSDYAQELSKLLFGPNNPPSAANSGRINGNLPTLTSSMRALRTRYAPKLNSVSALRNGVVLQTFNAPLGALTLPAGSDQIQVLFDPNAVPTPNVGAFRTSGTVSVTSPGEESGILGAASAAGPNRYVISLPDLQTQRSHRQSGVQPYPLTFRAANTDLFVSPGESFSVTTANTNPVAVADTFDPALSEVQNDMGTPIPYALDVLTKGDDDTDPDHTGARLTVSPANPSLSAAYGSLAPNADNTGYIYTAPAVLDATPRTVTFQYSAVDEEGGTSTPVTVTINVPAAAPPPPPKNFVAQDDLFVLQEGGSLTDAIVWLDNGNGEDDLDGALLGEVEFTADAPSEGTLTFRDDGSFDYTPSPQFSGDVTFTYRLSDGSSFDEAEVTLRVTPVNDPPVVETIALLSRNESRDPFVGNLLDAARVSDPDGDTLSVEDVELRIEQRPDGTSRTIDAALAVQVEGSVVTITPNAFDDLDNDEFADVTVSYSVSDGENRVPNTLTVTIIGLDNGLGRQAGAYADTLSDRYLTAAFGSHFEGQSAAPSACLTCHATLASIDADVDTVDECRQTPAVFTAYGLEICLNRDATAAPLSDLLRRLSEAEPNYAPRLAPTDTLQVLQSAERGTPIGAPLTTSSTGRDVFGMTAQIHSYLISAEDGGRAGTTDPTGQFEIDANGQLSVANADLAAGTYTIVVLPVNDAGQRDNNGARVSMPGFFSNTPGAESAVTIEVIGDLPTPVDDTVNALSGSPVEVPVLANDEGGIAEAISITSPPTNGVVVINDNLTVTYTANSSFEGQDSFAYTTENATGAANNSATVQVTVVAAEGVRAVNDSLGVIEGRDTVLDVLANDENARIGGANATVITLLSQPDPDTVGTLRLTGQTITFTPAAGFAGTAQFTYQATNPGVAANLGSSAQVTLSVVRVGSGVISDAVTDPELLRVAQSFEQSCAIVRDSGQGDDQSIQFLDVCALLTVAAENDENLTQAMQALRNEEYFAAVDATHTVARGLGRIVDRRLTQIREGAARGFDTAGVTLRVGDKVIPTELVTQALSGILGLGQDSLENPRWGMFVTGDLAWVERDAEEGRTGYDLEANNLMIGYDRILDEKRSFGVALGYAETTTDFAGGGSLKSKGLQASLYGVHRDFLRRDLTLDGYISVGRMKFDSERRIFFTNGGRTIDTTATAQFNGTYLNIAPKLSYSRVLGDYDDPIGALRTATRLTWSARLDYLWMRMDDYTETGGNGLGLNVNAETFESLILAFGLDASRPVYFGPDTKAEIYGGIEIRGELLDKERTISSAFAAAGANAPRFLVSEDGTHGLGAAIEIGTVFSVGQNGHIDINYGFDVARGGRKTQRISLGYRRELLGQDSLSIDVSRNFSSQGGGDTSVELDYRLRF